MHFIVAPVSSSPPSVWEARQREQDLKSQYPLFAKVHKITLKPRVFIKETKFASHLSRFKLDFCLFVGEADC